ncbi:hypothetical protein VCRA2110O318_40044 [Vibrio crassostreae]|nr:hypothetical protein VCRA2117O328_40044 [Vibrio crassostreae]CAK2335019.1 hypothetical protein VCRA2110O318_40044 [Vibrio crassostreae]CAK2503385.1 hypothetical protein VCRA2110O319_50044 [Vibrio crassostreae]CAK2911462.1 hypothetical protein VCRA217O317_30249 [Vibrio crassostreae]
MGVVIVPPSPDKGYTTAKFASVVKGDGVVAIGADSYSRASHSGRIFHEVFFGSSPDIHIVIEDGTKETERIHECVAACVAALRVKNVDTSRIQIGLMTSPIKEYEEEQAEPERPYLFSS